MRLGGPVAETRDPEAWIASLRALGYTAGICPLAGGEGDDLAAAFARAAAKAGIVIAEVGAWSNPLSPEEKTRREALELCRERLALADRIGARCCVNIAGSRGSQWDGPHPANLARDTFDLIVETVRSIIDAVKPSRTFYTLEPMPWIFPDSADSYLELIEAVGRPRFAVHLDPVNIINSPARYFDNAAVIRECFAKLGPWIKSCHAKDISLSGRLTVHLDEVRPGLGGLDYRAYLTCLASLEPDMPLIIEHLGTAGDYAAAAAHLRQVAGELGLAFA
ncbi:MAG: sugar phosphate isomerase/epimerase family protein [Patescibacteria group bacterium]